MDAHHADQLMRIEADRHAHTFETQIPFADKFLSIGCCLSSEATKAPAVQTIKPLRDSITSACRELGIDITTYDCNYTRANPLSPLFLV
jgi:hypothetical protein